MCWIGENKKQIAKENIPIFKLCRLIDGQIVSLYQEHPYNLNMPYYSEIHIEEIGLFLNHKITEGLHSYHPNVFVSDVYTKHIIWGLQGFLICTTDLDIIKVAGYIPKGSVYYLNYKGEYVSDKLVLTKIEKIKRIRL